MLNMLNSAEDERVVRVNESTNELIVLNIEPGTSNCLAVQHFHPTEAFSSRLGATANDYKICITNDYCYTAQKTATNREFMTK